MDNNTFYVFMEGVRVGQTAQLIRIPYHANKRSEEKEKVTVNRLLNTTDAFIAVEVFDLKDHRWREAFIAKSEITDIFFLTEEECENKQVEIIERIGQMEEQAKQIPSIFRNLFGGQEGKENGEGI